MNTNPQTVRGRTFREWAAKLGLSLFRIYQLHWQGQLEARIDGTWKPKQRKPGQLMFGKTARQWSVELGIGIYGVYARFERGDLERISKGQPIPNRKAKHLIDGKTHEQIAHELGISRQRVWTLAKQNRLAERLT